MQTAIAAKSKAFTSEDFLLENDSARVLYHEYAAHMPIIDYHNHLPPDQVAGDYQIKNITEVWLGGDHYKWRAMRTHGIEEYYITGDASPEEKFMKWAETVPYTVRNPLFHWTHLELSRYFGINDMLTPDNAAQIYTETNHQLSQNSHSVLGLLKQMNVELICTTDDPTDDLRHHKAFATIDKSPRMLPTFRPDKAILISQEGWKTYIEKLKEVSSSEIKSYDDLLAVLEQRIEFFHQRGCRISDHGLNCIVYAPSTASEIANIMSKGLEGQSITAHEASQFQFRILIDLSRLYHKHGWIQQFHLGALRNNNSRLLAQLGPDTGWDSIGDFRQAVGLSALLNNLDGTDQLTKTVIYNLNPADNEVFATMIGNFNDGSIKGKVQWGSGWWFLDQLDGMEKQINTLSNMGLISHFIGMLTDSRSFLSFPRHEYFRRLLCNIFGRDIERGLLPKDYKWIGGIISDISYNNVKEYIGE